MAGKAMTVSFQLFGQDFTALNGEPQFKFTPAISMSLVAQPPRRAHRGAAKDSAKNAS